MYVIATKDKPTNYVSNIEGVLWTRNPHNALLFKSIKGAKIFAGIGSNAHPHDLIVIAWHEVRFYEN